MARIATRLPGERYLAEEDRDRIAAIRGDLIRIGDGWRKRHPFLAAHQDGAGMAIFLVSIAGVLADAVLYAAGLLPWYATILITAFWLSLLHELEHDLIHSMYFRQNRMVHNLMMFGVWFFRPSTINPWIRRTLHLHHHEVSGTDSDLEERGITNGEGWGAHRLASLMDSMLGIYTKPLRQRAIVTAYIEHEARSPEEARKLAAKTLSLYFPLGVVHYTLWHLFIGVHAYAFITGNNISGSWVTALNFIAVTLLAPNAVRTFCLHFVSSNMHYYGDVEKHNVMQQTQVWTAKWLKPFHALCFNFGETHAIHHFLVRDPFYLREAIKHDRQKVLRDNGVRFNDFGTFQRANRFSLMPAHVEP
ncbi:fatty acid desaturase [Mycobacterium sp. CBMA293]|uniref:fatty acid desaturase n=1 Tax=unclassified Mycolicibacterium TaxID=2636767 RepID=UPI0012DFE281|nr:MULTISPECIES: fatty acid desaturase [unclassified Mycolicibacterium]MUL49853.1 fatty acid desaturase [Mycolicibacterium sp. CBMA 360]MUL61513.1 fatty acid desaturase [Mycolicibacterium sp. CBMA 335]MUL74248.1 fatty acid desaturase [Mycolicibacterium sp. CBMA 311]MUL97126.1 fatty acid desaturase [Mycolicibacterium sp. CBMA 230]MUM08186.1 fatty acid desaturase [Mycolicibacterium sp. CBMA 213]